MQAIVEQKVKFSTAIGADKYQKLINNTLQDTKTRQRFVASIISAVGVNPALQECTTLTILAGALLGESLKLSPSPQLGQFYLVPFEDKKKGVTNAVFVLGYKGMIQLATRSGHYKHINAIPVKKGEFGGFNPLTEEFSYTPIPDELTREMAETIGYFASIEYLNGFKKCLYWSKEKMLRHAERYSAAFGPAQQKGKYPGRVAFADYSAGKYNKDDEWAYSSYWYKDFDGMACKTMLRQLISHWGAMSVEMQQAYIADEHTINENLEPDYIGLDEPDEGRQTPTDSDTQNTPTDEEKAEIEALEREEYEREAQELSDGQDW